MKEDSYSLDYTDIKELVDYLICGGNILFSFTPDKTNAYNIFISTQYAKLNVLPLGGNPRGDFIISIQGLGGFMYFNMNNFYHENYISEKLKMYLGDAKNIASLIALFQAEWSSRQ